MLDLVVINHATKHPFLALFLIYLHYREFCYCYLFPNDRVQSDSIPNNSCIAYGGLKYMLG